MGRGVPSGTARLVVFGAITSFIGDLFLDRSVQGHFGTLKSAMPDQEHNRSDGEVLVNGVRSKNLALSGAPDPAVTPEVAGASAAPGSPQITVPIFVPTAPQNRS